MFCSKCGSGVEEGISFCQKCGANMTAGGTDNVSNQPNTSYSSSESVVKSMNVIRIIASIVVIISTFIPFVSALGYSKSLFDGGDGVIFICLAALVILFDVLKKYLPAVIISIITVGLAAYEVFDAMAINSDSFGLLQYGGGFYLLIIGAIAMLVSGPINKAISKK